MSLELFHPLVAQWFDSHFKTPTQPQVLGWPKIKSGQNTLIAAPTGSGKTLTAFLASLDELLRQGLSGLLPETTEVVYVSPLKALSNDIHRNLQTPLSEIQALALASGVLLPPLRALVRTGDTPAHERQAMKKNPPHILVTTPESLFLVLTSPKSRDMLKNVKTVIVDEIHALARDKRGSHLALSLARLDHLCQKPPQRIGLSATQKPLEEIARFLVGQDQNGQSRPCEILDMGHLRQWDLDLELPPTELSSVCSHETWEEIYNRLVALIQAHRSTLIFVNTRRMAERLSYRLSERLGENAVASHHGSLSREIRLSAEERLKTGQLKAIVATASLELGIDVGYIDLVCQMGSPRSIAVFLQRIGRAGHALHATPKGRLVPLTRDDLMEGLALLRAVREGRLDQVEIPQAPVDILAQQIVAACAVEPWQEEELFDRFRQAYPYRALSWFDYERVLEMLTRGIDPKNRQGAYLYRDKLAKKIKARRGARIAASTSGGAIPENADYRVVTEDSHTFVGTVNEDFALESQRGDVFLLGNSSWRILHVRGGEVTVQDAQGAPASIPFWLGEAPGRTIELSEEISRLREDLETKLRQQDDAQVIPWLAQETLANPEAARQAVGYARAELAALGLLPTQKKIIFERFFDDTGGMQLVIHSPYGMRINRAWGLALRKRFCRSFDFELQAQANDNGIVLSLGPQHSFPIESLFPMLGPHNARDILVQALLAVPLFQIRWRWNLMRSLAVLRFRGGKKVPPPLQRFQSDDLLTAVFPAQTACFENRPGDVPIPDHPLVKQTLHDCLHEATDLDRWIEVLTAVQSGNVELLPKDTREPSPFCYELLNSNPYTFLDDAPLEERRARAVAMRRTLPLEDLKDLGQLDPGAIFQVQQDAWPLVRDRDEMLDVLISLGFLLAEESAPWSGFLQELESSGRATTVNVSGKTLWVALERWGLIQGLFPAAACEKPAALPEEWQKPVEFSSALLEILRARMAVTGPVTAVELSQKLGIQEHSIVSGLEALEGEGTVVRGTFSKSAEWCDQAGVPAPGGSARKYPERGSAEWCDRRLLARIHRLTLDGLRRQVKPVSLEAFWRFLAEHQHAIRASQKIGRQGLEEVLWQLQGLELPAGSWEQDILPLRVADYSPHWMDELTYSGDIVWGRLSPPAARLVWSGSVHQIMPIALVLREDLSWLLPQNRSLSAAILRENAKSLLAVFEQGGALFWNDLQQRSGLLSSQLEEALEELASYGFISSDGFSAIRASITPSLKKRIEAKQRRYGSRNNRIRGRAIGLGRGRWSLFPGNAAAPAEPAKRLESWAWQLLERYGIVFWDLVSRESSAPSWHELAPVYRRMELRGEIRGGRFVEDVSGEQYALPGSIEPLRRAQETASQNQWTMISAADPLNLTGLGKTNRIAASGASRLLYCDGRLTAALVTGEIRLFAPMPESAVNLVTRALQLTQAPLLRQEALENLRNIALDLV